MPRNFVPEYFRRIIQKAKQTKQSAQKERDESDKERRHRELTSAIQSVEKELHRESDEDAPQEQRDRCWERAGIIGLWAAALVGVAAIVVGNIDASRQRNAMQSQLDLTKTQLRPYIAFVNVSVEPQGAVQTFVVHWKNFGATPGTSLREKSCFTQVGQNEISAPQGIDFKHPCTGTRWGDNNDWGYGVSPGMATPGNTVDSGPMLIDPMTTKLDATFSVLVMGTMDYADLIGGSGDHHAQYCVIASIPDAMQGRFRPYSPQCNIGD